MRSSLATPGGCTPSTRRPSRCYIGRNIPNTPLLAAVVRCADIMTADEFFGNMRGSFAHKFASKPEVLEGNMKAIQEAWEEVREA